MRPERLLMVEYINNIETIPLGPFRGAVRLGLTDELRKGGNYAICSTN